MDPEKGEDLYDHSGTAQALQPHHTGGALCDRGGAAGGLAGGRGNPAANRLPAPAGADIARPTRHGRKDGVHAQGAEALRGAVRRRSGRRAAGGNGVHELLPDQGPVRVGSRFMEKQNVK